MQENDTHVPIYGIFMYHYLDRRGGLERHKWSTSEWTDLTPKSVAKVASELGLSIDNGRIDLSSEKVAYLKFTSKVTNKPADAKYMRNYAYIGSGDDYEVRGAIWTVSVGLMNTNAEWFENVESFDFYLPCAGKFQSKTYSILQSRNLYVQHIHACIEEFEDKVEAYLKHLIERFGK